MREIISKKNYLNYKHSLNILGTQLIRRNDQSALLETQMALILTCLKCNKKQKTLQKKLIAKTQQVVQKEVLVHQKQKQIDEIRQIMKRQPGLQVAEKLSIMQRILNIKTRIMKELASKINMYQTKTNESIYDIEKVSKQIQQIKRKYNEKKNSNRQLERKDFTTNVKYMAIHLLNILGF